MDTRLKAVAQTCLAAAHDGSMDFPTIVATLINAGFESYTVDYRRGRCVYYRPCGDSVELPAAELAGQVAAVFQTEAIAAAVREAQSKTPEYTYRTFCEKVRAAGCTGYTVSFPGRRVVYFGRTAEIHVEHFPS